MLNYKISKVIDHIYHYLIQQIDQKNIFIINVKHI